MEQSFGRPEKTLTNAKRVALGLATLSLAQVLHGCSAFNDQPDVVLHVDCEVGPREAAAGGLSMSEEDTIRLEVGSKHYTAHARLGKIAMGDHQLKAYRSGEQIADLGAAIFIAGTPASETDPHYIDGDQAATLLCKNATP